jgi:hypothetical protein
MFTVLRLVGRTLRCAIEFELDVELDVELEVRLEVGAEYLKFGERFTVAESDLKCKIWGILFYM